MTRECPSCDREYSLIMCYCYFPHSHTPSRFLSRMKIIPSLIHCINQSTKSNSLLHQLNYSLIVTLSTSLSINHTLSPHFLCTTTYSSSPSASSSSSSLYPLLVSLEVSTFLLLNRNPLVFLAKKVFLLSLGG